jgi:hypothetical protein
MFTLSKFAGVLALCAVLALPAAGQDMTYQPPASVKVDLPSDSPLALRSTQTGESRSGARGGALILDLRLALTFQNTTQKRVRGVALLVLAQDVTPGGKASVTMPGLNVAPGETFPVRVDVRLLQPLVRNGTPLVNVSLDGVLFDDLSFHGPNQLNSRRIMTAWELEARRDRHHLQRVLEAKGPEGLRQEMLDAMQVMAQRPNLNVRVVGRATAGRPVENVQFAFVQVPASPLEPVQGVARVSGAEAWSPQLEVVNRSKEKIRYFELGWIIRDDQGRTFLAGVLPPVEKSLTLSPGEHTAATQQRILQFSGPGNQPIAIKSMSSYVSMVEFADGRLWIPDRGTLTEPGLRRVVGPSGEEERLVELYKRKGLTALVDELKRF